MPFRLFQVEQPLLRKDQGGQGGAGHHRALLHRDEDERGGGQGGTEHRSKIFFPSFPSSFFLKH